MFNIMKKTLFLLGLLFSVCKAAMAGVTINNNTNCPITVAVYCYNLQCGFINIPIAPVIPPMNSYFVDECDAAPGNIVFRINWTTPMCQSGGPVTVSVPGNCNGFPTSAPLPTNCSNCTQGGGTPPAQIVYVGGGVIDVNP